jgi:putative ABC transport system permease protein
VSTELEPAPRRSTTLARREPAAERGGPTSALVGSVVEAWDELRVHRGRVLLSLIGVGVAVAALTSVLGIGAIAQQAQVEQLERGSGRPATLVLGVPFDPVSGAQADAGLFRDAVATAVERYAIEYSSSNIWADSTVQFPDGATSVGTQAVDVDFGIMHRIELGEGRWFTDRDELRLAPALVVNNEFWERIGSPPLQSHPTVTILGEQDVTAVIVGVTPPMPYEDGYYSMFMLRSAWESLAGPAAVAQAFPQVEFWIPVDLAEQLTTLIKRDIAAAFGDDWQVEVNRQDYLAWGNDDPTAVIRLVLAGIAVLILLLGALGLVNISLVTVRQRIQEIGIRRAFGATAPRVFFAVMMESVVATFVAGAVGVGLAIALVQSPMVQDFIAPGLVDVPPFPVGAALMGLGAATLVGALAGLLPALVAVRVKVIDAIRY